MSSLPASVAAIRTPPPGTYYDPALDADVIKLLPAEWRVSSEPIALATVLGSCVAACIFDGSAKVGGMNHFMLPDAAPGDASARYGAHAMELLINGLLKHGAMRSRLQAKVFGGGNVLRGFTATNVGERNAAFVLEYLKTENIPVVAKDLVDIYPRKVYFFPENGKVMVRKLRSLHNSTIMKREGDYSRRLRSGRVAGDVELFG